MIQYVPTSILERKKNTKLSHRLSDKCAVQCLDFRGNRMHSVHRFASLCHALGVNRTIRRLILMCSFSTLECAQLLANALAANKSITDLNLYNTELGDERCAVLSRSLNGSVRLDLTSNLIGSGGAESLGSELTRCQMTSTLRELHIGDNRIGSRGAAALFQRGIRLRTPVVCANALGDDGAVALARALADNARWLCELDLNDSNISCRGALALAGAIAAPHCALRELVLSFE
jgi:Leucine Rich repeat